MFARREGLHRIWVRRGLSTHKRQAAVVADRDLGLVRVDEDARVAGGPAPAVAGHDAFVRPADGLLVDELYGGVGLGL